MANKIGQIQIEFVAKTDQLQGQIDAINKKISTTTSTVKAQGREWDSSVTRMQAASAAIRGFNGSMNTRAVERYIATFKGLSDILVKAFPVVGALALTTIVVDLGEKLYAAGKKAIDAGQNIKNAFNAANGELETSNDELRTSNDRLADHIAKLTGHRPNILKDELDAARESADKLADAMEQDSDKADELLKKYSVGFKDMLAAVLQFKNIALTSGLDKSEKKDAQENRDASANTHAASANVGVAVDALDAAKASGDKAAITTATAQLKAAKSAMEASTKDSIAKLERQAAGIKVELKKFQDKQAFSDAIMKHANSGVGLADGSAVVVAATGDAENYHANIENATAQINQRNAEIDKAKQMMQGDELKIRDSILTAQKEAAAKAKELQRQQTEALVASWREREDKLKNAGDQTKQQLYNFWKAMKAEAEAGQTAYSAAVNADAIKIAVKEMGTAYQAAEKEVAEADDKMKKEQAATVAELQKKAGEMAPALVWGKGKNGSLSIDNTDHPYGGTPDEEAKRSEEIQKQQALTQDAMKKATLAAGQAFREQSIQIALATGNLSKHDAAMQLAQIHADAIRASIASMTAERQAAIDDNKDGVNNSEINRLSIEINKTQAEQPGIEAADQNKINMETPLGAATDALNEWTQNALDSAAQIKNMIDTTLNGFNDAVVSGKRGAFQNYGKDLFKNVEKTGLQRAEGYGMKALGIGGKADGSASNPWHVIIAGAKAGVGEVGKLFPGVNSASGGNSPTNVVGSVIGNFFRHMLGFADGGNPPVGVPSLVGENGPELFVPRSAGTVVSNGKFGTGGDHYWSVDARGSNDPAGTARMIKEAMVTTHKKAVTDAVKAVSERTYRRPSTAR